MNQGGDIASSHFFREIQIELLIHDLEDPFVVIEAGLQNLLRKQDKFGALTASQERVLRRSLRASLRGRSMLSILLEVGRSEFGHVAPAPFAPLKVLRANVLESAELFGIDFPDIPADPGQGQTATSAALARAGIVIDATEEAGAMEIIQDEYTFSEIVGNVIKNALRFRKEKLEIRCYRDGDALVVEVGDDGPGITAENHDLIFQPFAQADAAMAGVRRGRGLGLAAARVLARRLGGDIAVRSEPGSGATFVVTVPLQAPSPM